MIVVEDTIGHHPNGVTQMDAHNPPMEVLVRMAHVAGKVIPHDGELPECWTYNRKKYFSRGVHAKFRKLTTKWGMKFYYDQEERDENYSVMSRAAWHGLAPLCVGKFKFKLKGHTYYGFIVECCPPVGETPGFDYWEMDKQFPYLAEDTRYLSEKLQAIGIPPEDLHHNNVAYKGDKLVAIDLSCSTPHEHEFHRH